MSGRAKLLIPGKITLTTKNDPSENGIQFLKVGRKFQPVFMLLGMTCNFVKDFRQFCLRRPLPKGASAIGVHYHPGNVKPPRRGVSFNLMFAKPFNTPAAELQQRKRISRSAAKIENPGFRLAMIIKLFEQQRHQIARVQHITRLMAVTAETNVFERATAQAGINPETDDALIGSSELSRARQQAAAVDPNRQAKCLTIFERKKFRSQFAGAIEGKRRHGGKFFGHA